MELIKLSFIWTLNGDLGLARFIRDLSCLAQLFWELGLEKYLSHGSFYGQKEHRRGCSFCECFLEAKVRTIFLRDFLTRDNLNMPDHSLEELFLVGTWSLIRSFLISLALFLKLVLGRVLIYCLLSLRLHQKLRVEVWWWRQTELVVHPWNILLNGLASTCLKQEHRLLVGVDLSQEIFLDLIFWLNLAVQREKTLWNRLIPMNWEWLLKF